MLNRQKSLRIGIAAIALVLVATFMFAAKSGNLGWFGINKASAESAITPAPDKAMVIGTCDVATAALPIEVESTAPASGPTAYANLAAAIAAINAGTHQGTINVEVCFNSTETGAMFLNSNAAAPAAYTSISIRPLSDGLTISGPTVLGRGLIELNGADDVTIDGDNPNSGGTNRDLTITNTAAVTVNLTSVIRIAVVAAVPTANNITIRNLNINGSATGRNAAANTSTTNSENSSFGIYAGGLATGAITAPGPLTSVSTNSAAAGTTINAFNVTNNAVNACARGIFFNGAVSTVSTLVTIANNLVGEQSTVLAGTPPYIAPTTTVYTKPIWVAGTTSFAITGNSVKNILSYVGTGMFGIEINSANGTGPFTISNNTVDGVVNNGTASGAFGIGFNNAAAAATYTVSGNTVNNIQSVGGVTIYGIQLSTTASPTSALVEKNRVSGVNSRGSGGFGSYGINLGLGSGITVQNNFVWNINAFLNNSGISSSFGPHGIRIASGNNHRIYHNSVNLFGAHTGASSTSLSSAFTIVSTGATLTDVRNNIFSNTMTGAFSASTPVVAMFLPSGGTSAMNLILNNNDYREGVGAGAAIAQVGTTSGTGVYLAANFNAAVITPATNLRSYTTLLTAAGTDDNASTVVDPLFVSDTDLHLQAGSTVRDVGAIIVAVTNDIDSQLRPGGNALYDIGADEFDGTTPPVNDLQGTAFIDPTNGGSKPTGVAFSPQASFTNNGTATQTSVTVRYRICTDGTCTTEIYNNTAVIASIAPSATANVTFPSTTIAVAATYTTKARSELGTDTVPANDEITGTVILQAPLAGSYTVGAAGAYPSLTNAGGIFEAINSLGASGPVTIEIITDLTGETGAVALNPIAGSPTVLIKPSGGPRTISGVAPIAVIRFNGSDNIRLDGSTAASFAEEVVGGTPALRELTVRNDSTSTSSGVLAMHSNTDGAQNNAFQNVNVDGNSPTTTIVGISLGGAAIGTSGTDNDGNDVINCRVRRALFGIYSAGAIPPNQNIGTRIEQNAVDSTGADRIRRGGILVFNEDGIQIIENSVGGIDNTGEGADAFGIGVGTQFADIAFASSGGIVNANVTRNRVNGVSQDATFSAFGIGIAGGNTPAGLNNVVSNNMVTGVISDGNAGDLVAGIFVVGTPGSDTRLYYNSVSMTGDRSALSTPATAQYPSYGIAITGTDPVVELKNNIFYTTQVAEAVANPGALSFGIGMQSAAFTNLNSNFNDFFSSGVRDGGFRTTSLSTTGGVNLAALAAWTGATGDDPTPDSMEADPVFADPTSNLHLNTIFSPAYDQGTIVSVLDDYDGQIRATVGFAGGVPDIGADEILAPLAAAVNIGGRVTQADGFNGLSRVNVTISGGNLTAPRNAITNPFGYYNFEDLQVGQTYILTVGSKRYTFMNPTIVVTAEDNISDANFFANP